MISLHLYDTIIQNVLTSKYITKLRQQTKNSQNFIQEITLKYACSSVTANSMIFKETITSKKFKLKKNHIVSALLAYPNECTICTPGKYKIKNVNCSKHWESHIYMNAESKSNFQNCQLKN